MMYEKFSELLQNRGLTAAAVSRGTGLSQTVFSEWKKGKSTPKVDKLQKIADFFGVPLSYFVGETETEETDPIHLDDETREIIDILRKRPEMKTLFKVARDATKEDIEDASSIIEKFKKGSGSID